MRRIVLACLAFLASCGFAFGVATSVYGPGIRWYPMECDSYSPAADQRLICYDRSADQLQKWNGTAWVSVESSGAGLSLDGAYDNGQTITVDSTDVTLNLDVVGASLSTVAKASTTVNDGIIASSGAGGVGIKGI